MIHESSACNRPKASDWQRRLTVGIFHDYCSCTEVREQVDTVELEICSGLSSTQTASDPVWTVLNSFRVSEPRLGGEEVFLKRLSRQPEQW